MIRQPKQLRSKLLSGLEAILVATDVPFKVRIVIEEAVGVLDRKEPKCT
jgi:hypothetical protein